MVANLGGIIFSQIYGDNSGGAEFDTDGDGTTTQEDEFVSLTNTTGAVVDLSGWQIWSDMSGAGAPDGPQDGLYHTFPPSTTLAAGETLYIVNEITGTPPSNMQEASEGGLESGAGGVNTNFLSEGDGSFNPEGVALVNPATGDYIVINMSASASSNFTGMSGFPGTTLVATSNTATDSGVEDQNAGSSYQYNAATDSYDYAAVAVLCFAAGTLIAVPGGERPIEDLEPGDPVVTLDHGVQQIRKILRRQIDFSQDHTASHKPVEFKPGSIGPDVPNRRLKVSPQHRMLVRTVNSGEEVLVPAKALTHRAGVRVMSGCRKITYIHLVFDRHEVIQAHGCWSESYYPGAFSISTFGPRLKNDLKSMFPELDGERTVTPARSILGVKAARASVARDSALNSTCALRVGIRL